MSAMGLLAAALKGGANAVTGVADRAIAEESRTKERQIQMEMEREKLIFAEEMAARRAQRSLEMDEAKAKRDATIRFESEESSRTGLQNRKVVERAQNFHGPFQDEEARRTELLNGYEPKESEVYRGAMTEAMKRGGSSGLLNTIHTQAKDASTRERQAEIDAFNLRKQEALEADRKADREATERRLTDSERRTAAYLARGAGGGSGGGKSPAEIKAMTSLDIERSTKAAMNRVARKLGVPLERVNETLTRLSRSGKPLPEGLAEDLAMLDELEGRQMDLERNDPRPSTAKAETPENKPKPDPKTAPPAKGTVQGGYRFKGGDPSKQSNWEKV